MPGNAVRFRRLCAARTKMLHRAIEPLEPRRLLASIAGTVFNDIDADGIIDGSEGPLAGWTVFHDANLNGSRDVTAPVGFGSSDVPKFVGNGAATVFSSNPVSALIGLTADVNVTINMTHAWDGDMVISLIAPTGQEVTLASQPGGANNSGDNFTSTTFDDEASNSIDSGTPPYTGSFKPFASLAAFDGLNPNGTWQLKLVDVFPAADDGNLVSWSLSISTGETALVSDASGNFTFSNLSAGTYRLREIVQSPYAQTSPAIGYHDVTVATPDAVTGRNFGNRLPPGEIRGTKWSDVDNDGVKDAGEPALGGVTVYVDFDLDNVYDVGAEPSAVTAGDGTYAITGVPPGNHIVREIIPAGYNQTFPTAFGALEQGPQRVGPEALFIPRSTTFPAVNRMDAPLGGPLIRPIWAPGTSRQVVDDFYASPRTDDDVDTSNFTFADGARWNQTATNGSGLTQGQPTTLTWRIVADGVSIPGFNGEPSAVSNLQSFLNGIYGSSAVWLPLFDQIFSVWSAQTGITYVMETADDGTAFSNIDSPSTRGVLGVRADIRIGGHFIDGNPNPSVLAYNFFPNIGDMVIDTADNFYAANLANNSRGLRNVLAHEHGHGIGLSHVMPVSATKLMEPFVNLSFDGPQHDDILAANRGYGDMLEKSGGNDAIGTAYNLGALSNSTVTPATYAISTLSVDDDSDIDTYRFTVGSAKRATITISPVGSTYLSGTQGGPAPTSFNSLAQSDLTVQLIAPDGVTVVRSANVNGAGLSETLSNVALGAGGQYYFKVTGSANAAQLYTFTVTIADALGGSHSVTVAPSQILTGINFGNHANATGGLAGQVFQDRNSDGLINGTDIPLNGVEVYLDLNTNGVRDGADPFMNTSGAGNYSFSALASGTYRVREVIPAGHVATIPAGGFSDVVVGASVVTQNLGNFPITFTGGSAGNSYVVSTVGGTNTQIVETISPNPSVTYITPKANLGANSLTFNGAAGDDVLTIDMSAGNPLASGGGAVFNAAAQSSADILNIIATTAADTFNFNNGSIGGIGTPVTHAASVEEITYDGLASGGLDSPSIFGGPRITFPTSQRFATLTMSGGTARLAAGGTRTISAQVLSITGAARLDLTDNDLLINYSGPSPIGSWTGSTYDGVTGLIKSGRNGGNWSGSGIVTTAAVANYTTLGVAEASEVLGVSGSATTTYAGQTVDGTTLLVKFTYGGDARLDGKLNIDDYGRIDLNIPLGTRGWYNGDFNYDGKINIDDYGIIDFNANIWSGIL